MASMVRWLSTGMSSPSRQRVPLTVPCPSVLGTRSPIASEGGSESPTTSHPQRAISGRAKYKAFTWARQATRVPLADGNSSSTGGDHQHSIGDRLIVKIDTDDGVRPKVAGILL